MPRLHARRPFVWALILSLAFAGSAVAPASAATGGSIAGTVTGPDGAPAEGVYAVAYRRYVEEGYDEWEVFKYVKTDATGTYRVGSLPAGTYHLGFIDETGHGYLPEYWDDEPTVEAAVDITIAGGQAIIGKDAQLTDGGHITGTVTGPDGQGVKEVTVAAYRWHESDDDGYWSPENYVATDEEGRYDLGSLPTDTYRLGFLDFSQAGHLNEYWDDAATIETATDIEVTAGETVGGKDAELAEGGHITGTVTGADGEPLADIQVTAHRWTEDDGWEWAGYVETDADGHYDLNGLSTGSYRIGFDDDYGRGYVGEYWDDAATIETATDIDVTTGQTTGDKDAQLAEGGHITGTVTNASGHGLGDIGVVAYQWDSGAKTWRWVSEAYTDNLGGYDVGGLSTGSYRIEFYDEFGETFLGEFWDDADTIATATDIAVTEGQTTPHKDAVLDSVNSATAHLAGTVTGPDGRRLGGIAVQAYRWSARDDGWSWTASTTTSSTGDYDLAVGAGSYLIRFYDPSGTYVEEFWDNAPTATDARPVSVALGATISGRNATLAAVAAPALVIEVPPSIIGPVRVGSTLTATTGTWRAPGAATRFQWVIGGVPVPRATGTTYTPGLADLGKTLELQVTATAPGHAETAFTTRPATVAAGSLTATKQPKVTGKVKKGATLKASPGTWSPTTKVTVTYRWYAGAKAIPKATAAKLKLAGKTLKAVAGKAISVRVTVAAPGYSTATTRLNAPGRLRH